MMTLDHQQILLQLKLPLMIFQGLHENKQRFDGGKYLPNNIPDARLVTFEESAHMPQIEEMALFNQTLDKFISSTS